MLPNPPPQSARPPIEVVVIRHTARDPVRDIVLLAPPPEPPTDLPPHPASPPPLQLSPQLSQQQQQDLLLVAGVLTCPVRQHILVALASAGPAHVGGLAARTATDPHTISHHLHDLRTAGLVTWQRRGKQVWYEAPAERVRYQQHGDGHGDSETFSLMLTARGSDVTLTVMVGGSQ
jgi:Bacterial regulatory protein, arsR family